MCGFLDKLMTCFDLGRTILIKMTVLGQGKGEAEESACDQPGQQRMGHSVLRVSPALDTSAILGERHNPYQCFAT